MAEIFDLNVTDSSNTGRFPEGQAPSTVNNGARALEGMLARGFRDTIMPTKTSGGSANAQTLTTNQTISAYAAGTSSFVFKAGYTNTGTCTMNVDSLGAKTIKNLDGTNLAAGAITAGGYYWIVYDGTNFILLNSALVPYLPLTGGMLTGQIIIARGGNSNVLINRENNLGTLSLVRKHERFERGAGSGDGVEFRTLGDGANGVADFEIVFDNGGTVTIAKDGKITAGANGVSGLDVCTIQQLFSAVIPKADLASPAFTGNPTAPTQATSNDSTRIATTEFVKDASFGWGQTPQDVSGSRAANTTYQNTTGKPIEIAAVIAMTSSQAFKMGASSGSLSTVVTGIGGAGGNPSTPVYVTVPPGWYYRSDSAATINSWSEMR